MPEPNRTIDCEDWPDLGVDTTTNARTPIRDTDLNAWQDRAVRGKTLGSTLDFGAFQGCLWQYGQTALITDGSAAIFNVFNLDQKFHSVADRQLDMKRRIVLTRCWAEGTIAELPGGAAYDANTFLHSPAWMLWWTGDGATWQTGLVGTGWEAWADIWMFAKDTDDTFHIYNDSGADIAVVLDMMVFEQVPAAQTTGDPDEKRIWTQNLYEKIKATRLNRLQDSYVQARELGESTLSPVNVWEGAALYYGQLEALSATGLYLVDDTLDWRNRIVRTWYVDTTSGATYLPTENDYDPAVYTQKDQNLWWTGAGDNPGAPATGVNWQPVTSQVIAAANAASSPVALGDLFLDNGTGTDRWAMMLAVQHPETT